MKITRSAGLATAGIVALLALATPACSSDDAGKVSQGGNEGQSAATPRPTSASPSRSLEARTPNYNAGPADVSRSVVRHGPEIQIAHAESSRALRDLPSMDEDDDEAEAAEHLVRRIPLHPANVPFDVDPVLQARGPISSMPATILNFQGQGHTTTKSTVTGTPPDTNGAVGANNFVQVVNGGVEVWNKSGTVVTASKLINLLWSGYSGTNPGNSCAADNDGDPVVVYDSLADRWLISQFSLPNTNVDTGPSFQCVAVSKTGDPSGAYWLYDFSYPAAINDYGKFSFWPDGYYATFNLFGQQNFIEGDMCAYDRVSMLQGLAATQQCFPNANAYGIQPGNLDGAIPPPIGEPGYFAQLDTDTQGNFTNKLDLFKLHLDWHTPANTTITGPTAIPVAAFTPTCGTMGTCVPQGGATGKLDSLDDRLMFRLTYRNFGTHESLFVNHSVLAGTVGGVRWYEIRSPASTPVVYQQGTYAGTDSVWRWMGSIAEDQAEDLGLGFSLSSTTVDPYIGLTGRVPSDPLGTMGQGESTLDNGTSFEKGASRWGDYSNMTVDPADGCTFWYTQELYNTSGTSTWDTWIATMKFPTCGANDFSISVAPATQNVAPGGQAVYTVSTTSALGSPESVVLNIQDLPSGVTSVFNPGTITTGSTSTLTLTASASAPGAASAPFMVIGKAPSAVHAATANLAVTGCVPLAQCPSPQNCGTIGDGCGGMLSCGPTCTAPQTCGGNGVANVCGCKPASACPGGQNCGMGSDGCGGMMACGTCVAPLTCGGGANSNQCGCTPNTVCQGGAVCGTADDGCGGSISCGTCSGGKACVANQCVAGGAPDAGVAPHDAGVAAHDAGTHPDAASAGADGGGGGGGSTSGCGCRVAGERETPVPPLFAFAGLGLAAMLRLRRRR